MLKAGDAFDAVTINDREQRVESGLEERVAKALHNGRNLLINGNFAVWQRGLSITPTGAGFGPDHWRNYYTNVTYNRQANTSPGNSLYMLRSIATIANSQCLIRQKIEMQPRNKGGVVLSLWVRCNKAGLNFQIRNGLNGYNNKPISTTWSYLTHY